MRCLTLADELARRGRSVAFACASLPPALEERILASGHRLRRVQGAAPLHDLDGGWERQPLPAAVQQADARAVLRRVGRSGLQWVVLDHYLLSRPWSEAMRPTGANVLVIDDLANRPHDGDLLLDQTLGRAADDYAELVPDGCRVLAGARFALLRREFLAARATAAARPRLDSRPPRILVSLGTSDPDGVTARVVLALLATGLPCALDVVLGADAPGLDALRGAAAQDDRVRLHINSSRMASLMSAADLAVGAPGTSSWERCCLALPTVTVPLALNQRLIGERLAAAGAAICVQRPEDVAAAVVDLLDDPDRVGQMALAAAAVTDGLGAERVAQEMDDRGAHHA